MYKGFREAASLRVWSGVELPDDWTGPARAGSDELARVFDVAGASLSLVVGVEGSAAARDNGEK